MIRKITDEDFFDAFEMHAVLIQGHLEGKVPLSKMSTAYGRNETTCDFTFESMGVHVSLRDTQRYNSPITPIPMDYWDISFEKKDLKFTETLDLWGKYFGMGSVFRSSVRLDTVPRTIDCQIAISLETWDFMKKHRFLNVGNSKLFLF